MNGTDAAASPRRGVATLAVLCVLSGTSAVSVDAAENEPLDEVTVTGTQIANDYLQRTTSAGGFSDVDLREVPQSVQVLTGEFIRDTGLLSLGELLNAVPGASPSLSRTTPFGTAVTQIRGQDALIYRNGLRDVDYSDIDNSALINVERVEVLKGPAGIVYGTGGPGGIINIVTKMPEDEWSAEVRATLGTRSTRIVAGDVNVPLIDGLGLRVTAELERSDSFIDFSEIERDNVSATLAYEPVDWLRTSVVFERVSNRDDEAMTRIGLPAVGTIVDTPGLEIDHSTYLGEPSFDFTDSHGNMTTLRAEFDLTSNVTFEASLRRTNVTFEQAETARSLGALDVATATVPRNGTRQLIVDEDQWLGRGVVKAAFATGPLRHRVAAGFEYFDFELLVDFDAPEAATAVNVLDPVYDPQFGLDPADLFVITQQDIYREVLLQDVIELGDFTLTAGLRYVDAEFDSNSGDLQTVTYQAGGTWRTTETLSLFAGFNTGFEANSGLATTRSRTGEPFEPETFSQIELGIKTDLLSNVSGTLALFRILREDTLVTDPVDAAFDIQTGEERSLGLETDLVWQATTGLALRLGYAFLDAEISEDTDPAREGNTRPRAPRHQISGFANYTFGGGPLRNLRLTGGVSWIDEAFASISNEVERPAYALVSLGATYRYRKARFDLTATNVLDEEYYIARNDLQVNAGEPRLVTLRASLEF